jgi:prepilin-type N-terminal cleavage/methylation domain-containing protein
LNPLRSSKNHSIAGFTLIEIMMVIVITAIVSAVGVAQYIDFSKDAKAAVTKSRLNELRMAIVGDPQHVVAGQFVSPGFIKQVGSVPTSLTDLVAQGGFPSYNPFTKSGWRGPYVSTLEANWDKDGWGTSIQYSAGGRTLTSCGPDLTCGNGDDIVVGF